MSEINTGRPLYEDGITDPIVTSVGASLLSGKSPEAVEQELTEQVGDKHAAAILAAVNEEFNRA